MALPGVNARGFSLVELMVGWCVASIVAVMATTSLAAGAVAWQRHRVASRTEDQAWLALAAIARDLDRASQWRMCTEARDCPTMKISHRYDMPALVASGVGWLLADALRRCEDDCHAFVDGVASLEVIADMPTEGLTHRQPFLQRHEGHAQALEITLRMHDGRHFSRVVSRPAARP
jgi:hypothetical protein